MFIFINNTPLSINFFSPFTPSSQDKPLAVVSVQIDFENRLLQRKWTFTLGLDLVLNNTSSFGITKRLIKCYVKCKFHIQSFHTNNFPG